jgi:lipopolysaccharide export system protein LptA
MACKFHAAMRNRYLPALILCVVAAAATPVVADKGDRAKPVTVEADQPGTIDMLKQVVVFNGNVVIAQGTLVIRADRVEVRESPDGFRAATAISTGSRPASFRQKREGLDEYIEGVAERIEYDGRSDTVKFIGKASVRRLRAGTAADEITGNLITYDNTAEVFNVQGGPTNVSPTNPTGRVRAVLTPREEKPASAPAAASAPLRPTEQLGERR